MKISLETKEFRLRKNILSKRRKNVKSQTRQRIVAALPGEKNFINIHIILQRDLAMSIAKMKIDDINFEIAWTSGPVRCMQHTEPVVFWLIARKRFFI